MAKSQLAQLVCLLYLTVSGPIIANAARLQPSAKQLKASKEKAESETAHGHPWCNIISKQKTRSYHFDIEYNDPHCENGNCAAIELVRDKNQPTLNIWAGKQWKVLKSKDGEITWDRYSPGPEVSEENHINLLDTEVVRFMDAASELPDTLEIIISSSGPGHNVKQDVFKLEGGLYYNPKIISKGLEEVDAQEMREIEEDAAKPTYAATGRSKGKWIGGVGGALTVGGMYTAATIAGTAVQTQALIGAAVCGIVGGTMSGFMVGGIVGGAIGLGVAIAGYGTYKGYKIVPASRKIFEKLRCLDEFKSCSKNVLVPKDKDCPRK